MLEGSSHDRIMCKVRVSKVVACKSNVRGKEAQAKSAQSKVVWGKDEREDNHDATVH